MENIMSIFTDTDFVHRSGTPEELRVPNILRPAVRLWESTRA